MKNKNISIIFIIVSILMLTLAGCNNFGPTGQGIQIKLPKETLKKMVEETTPSQDIDVMLPRETLKLVEKPTSSQQIASQNICECPDLFGGKIVTVDQGGTILAGLSSVDCKIMREIIQLRKELKLDTSHLKSFINYCDLFGYY